MSSNSSKLKDLGKNNAATQKGKDNKNMKAILVIYSSKLLI